MAAKKDEELLRRDREKAEGGSAVAMYNMGHWYLNGEKGVRKDQAEAARWWRKAAIQGNASSQNMLGLAYRDGTGVVQDLVMARSISRPTIFGTLRLAMP